MRIYRWGAAIIAAIALIISFVPIKAQNDVKIPILLYHNLMNNIEGEDPLVTITPEGFKAHMLALKNAGYEAITFEEYLCHANSGAALPKKPVLITFDDGYTSNYKYAFPILTELEIKATIFVVTETVGLENTRVNYPHFTWGEAREMVQSGLIEIGSHSHSHKNIALLEREEAIREIRLSKYLIETNLGKRCSVFAFPYGKTSDFAVQAVSLAGYTLQCRVGDSGYNTKESYQSPLRRITIDGRLTAEEFLKTISDNLQKDLDGSE